MSIDRIDGSGMAKGPDRPAKEPGAQRTSPAGTGGDRVELSSRAKEIAGLAETSQRLPEVREERVATLKREIADGTYRVDAKQVARALLEYEHGSVD